MFTLGSQTACDGLRDLWAPKVRAAASLDAPETLEALRASARPGDRVEVRRRPREGFDFRCGHSGLCLVVLPIALAVSVLPPLYDDASLSRGGQTRFRGAFDLRGRLVQGVIRDGGMQRELRRVHLPALDQDWLVEVARAPILPDGGVGPVTRTPIARQVDLVGPYRRAMIVARSPQARGGLAAEAVRTLGTDAVPIALERIAARDDEAVSTMFTNLCSASVPSQGVLIEDASFDAARTALLGAFVAAATPTASGAALSCAGLSAAQRTRLVQTLTREVCSAPPRGRRARARSAHDPRRRAALRGPPRADRGGAPGAARGPSGRGARPRRRGRGAALGGAVSARSRAVPRGARPRAGARGGGGARAARGVSVATRPRAGARAPPTMGDLPGRPRARRRDRPAREAPAPGGRGAARRGRRNR